MDMLKVGEKLPLGGQLDKYKSLDASILELLEDGGLVSVIFLNKPKSKEVNAITNEVTTLRLYEEDDFILPMIRFGRRNFIFELGFDPTLYDDERVTTLKDTNNTILIILVDSSNFIIKGMRMSNLPLDFLETSVNSWSKSYFIKDFSGKYNKWYQGLRRMNIMELWNNARATGALGEDYNIKDINFN